MFKQLVSKKKSIIFTWLISYILVLFTPIIINSIIYIETEKVIENESMRANNGVLLQTKERMDALISEVKRLSTDMVFNPRVQELTRVKNPLNDAQKYNIYKINQDLKSYGASNKMIDEFYIYFKNVDMVLSPAFNSDSHSFFSIKHESENLNYEAWKEINSRSFLGEYVPLVRKTDSGIVKKSIAYIQTVPAAGGYADTATAVVMFDEDRFFELLKNFDLIKNGTFLILNKNNNILYNTSTIKLNESLSYEKLNQDQDIIYKEIDGQKFAISYVTSQQSNWKYMAIVPMSVFWEKIQYVSNLTKISILFCLCLGSILIYYLIKKNYNPVNKLVRLIQSKLEVDFEEGDSSEYSFLEKAVTVNMAEKEKIKSKLEQQNVMLKSTYLSRLLKGSDNNTVSIYEFLETFHIYLQTDYFAVMLFYIEDVEELFPEEKDLDFAQRFKMLQFIITNVVEELVGQKNIGIVIEVDNMMACIVNFSQDRTDNAEELLRVAREAQNFISEQFHIHITVAISNMNETTKGVAQAYQQALQAMEYKLVVGTDEIIQFKEIQQQAKSNYYYPLEKEQQLINNIKLGDFPKVKIILDEVFRVNFKDQLLPIDMAKCLVFNLISTMINTVNEISSVVDNDFLKTLNPVERLLHDETVDDIKLHITDILKQVCEYIVQKNNNARDDVRVGTVEFIHHNYHDKNLSITMVAEQFEMTGPYVSKLFKEQTGETLVDYINKFRIEKAKELMNENNNFNLEQVADIVGYSSIRTFSRYFNKYMGMSPGKYKELNSQ